MSDEPLLRLAGASRRYGTGEALVEALHPTDFSVKSGEFTCIAGPSGSGKSTLLNLAGLLDKPSEGEVFVEGVATASLTRRARSDLRRGLVGFIFQEANLLPVLSALENVEFALTLRGAPKSGRTAKAFAALEQVGLGEKTGRLPRQLSGGERQRVAVARAMALGSRLIIADEPTASLDGETGAALIALLKELNRKEGTTFLLSSHDSKVIAAALRIVRLRDGRISHDGNGLEELCS